MKIKAYILLFIAALFAIAPVATGEKADSAPSKEYQVKAAFIYNFINFIEWPEQIMGDDIKEIKIGIIGDDPFKAAFDPIKSKLVKNKKIVIERFGSFKKLKEKEAINNCHLIFIASSEKGNCKTIVETIGENTILTIGDHKKILRNGGIIEFFEEDNKIRFNINNEQAKKAQLVIRSKLLRLAKNQGKFTPAKDEN
jgi:hypothetical protein